jgi:hypothetical protein
MSTTKLAVLNAERCFQRTLLDGRSLEALHADDIAAGDRSVSEELVLDVGRTGLPPDYQLNHQTGTEISKTRQIS